MKKFISVLLLLSGLSCHAQVARILEQQTTPTACPKNTLIVDAASEKMYFPAAGACIEAGTADSSVTISENKLGKGDASGNVTDSSITDNGTTVSTAETLTLGHYTATRIPYFGTAGLLSDTANFTWINANKRLKLIGDASDSNIIGYATGDTQPRYGLGLDGSINFGDGSNGLDTSFKRTGDNALGTANELHILNPGGKLFNDNFTEGSILFAGANGEFKESNANFFWNNTDKKLTVYGGASDPAVDLAVFGNCAIGNCLTVRQDGGIRSIISDNGSYAILGKNQETTAGQGAGVLGQASNSDTSTGNLVGVLGDAEPANTSGTINYAVGVAAIADMSGIGTVTDLKAFEANTETDDGVITNLYGMHVLSPYIYTPSVVTNFYGIKVDNVTSQGNGTPASSFAIKTGLGKVEFGDNTKAPSYSTTTNCSDSAGDAACSAAAAGSVVMDATDTTTVVSTTAVTANSQIFIQEDSSLGTRLGITCNTTIVRAYAVTARTAATSFTITASAAQAVNPACLSYHIIN